MSRTVQGSDCRWWGVGWVSQEEYNRLTVRIELQADFFAGVWAHHTQKVKQVLETFRRGFETGDLNQGDTFRVSESQL